MKFSRLKLKFIPLSLKTCWKHPKTLKKLISCLKSVNWVNSPCRFLNPLKNALLKCYEKWLKREQEQKWHRYRKSVDITDRFNVICPLNWRFFDAIENSSDFRGKTRDGITWNQLVSLRTFRYRRHTDVAFFTGEYIELVRFDAFLLIRRLLFSTGNVLIL